ncbi:MAG: transglutaminase family protein [Gammaproteobacteria bacterium]|jgi:transglutaminase-like putative cysteine protease
MKRIQIIHSTVYRYAEPVRFLRHKLYLRPREGHDIRIESSALTISPSYAIDWYRDVYGNSVAAVEFTEPGDQLEIVSTVIVEHYEPVTVTLGPSAPARQFPLAYDAVEQIDLVPYQTPVFPEDGERLAAWTDDLWLPGPKPDTPTLLATLAERIVGSLEYVVRNEPGVQSPATTLDRGKGSCRDLATLFIECCRQRGVAARFVSGYLVSAAAVADVATTHAWAEVYLPLAGWRGVDATSGQLVGGQHIAVAVHRHPEAVPPVSGSFVGSAATKPKLRVAVEVTQL